MTTIELTSEVRLSRAVLSNKKATTVQQGDFKWPSMASQICGNYVYKDQEKSTIWLHMWQYQHTSVFGGTWWRLG